MKCGGHADLDSAARPIGTNRQGKKARQAVQGWRTLGQAAAEFATAPLRSWASHVNLVNGL